VDATTCYTDRRKDGEARQVGLRLLYR